MQEGCLLYGGRSFYYVTGNYSKPLNINVFETIQQSAKDKEDMTKLFVN